VFEINWVCTVGYMDNTRNSLDVSILNMMMRLQRNLPRLIV